MLPWIEVSCTNYPDPGSTVINVSGSDLAFGEKINPRIRIPMIVFTCILIGGIVAGFALAGPHLMPSIRRATVVGWVGLLCILLPLSLTFTYKEYIVSECRFTLWYYLSYVTSAGSVLLSVSEAKIILSKQVAVSQTVPRWVLCFLFGWSLMVVAWFLPVIGESPEGGVRAIDVAFRIDWVKHFAPTRVGPLGRAEAQYIGPPLLGRTGFQKFLVLLGLLSNVVILASFAIKRTLFTYGSILAGCALLNAQWLFYGVIPHLRLGYYCWLASFIVVAVSAFLRARHQGDGSVSTRELFARAVPVFFLMNLGIFVVLGISWFVNINWEPTQPQQRQVKSPPGGGHQVADPTPQAPVYTKKIAEETADAWRQAGGSLGSMGLESSDFWNEFRGMPGLTFNLRGPRDTNEIRTFRFTAAPLKRFAELPPLGLWTDGGGLVLAPFGLELRGPWVTDAVLKELPGVKNVKNLHSLNLVSDAITDAGLGNLAGLKL
jgi:hypothetical protein